MPWVSVLEVCVKTMVLCDALLNNKLARATATKCWLTAIPALMTLPVIMYFVHLCSFWSGRCLASGHECLLTLLSLGPAAHTGQDRQIWCLFCRHAHRSVRSQLLVPSRGWLDTAHTHSLRWVFFCTIGQLDISLIPCSSDIHSLTSSRTHPLVSALFFW